MARKHITPGASLVRTCCLLCVVGVLRLSAGPAWCAAADEMAPNGGLEREYRSGLAPSWEPNCYGENSYRFRPETGEPHTGASAQAAECTRFATGGVQFRCRGISVEKGKPYTLSVWLRGTATSPVFVGLRKHGWPYTRYLARYVRVGPKWRRYTLMGPAAGTDPDCGIYLKFASTGLLVVDDVSLRPGLHPPQSPAILAPPNKGNRLYNASFEVGRSGWVPLGDSFEIVETATKHGRRAARRALRHSGLLAESRPFALTAGQRHTFSAWIRRIEGPGEVALELVEYADAGGDRPTDRDALRATALVGPEWTRVQVAGIVEAGFTDGHIVRLFVKQPGTYWLDALQVEEGDLTDFAPSRAVEAAVDVPMLERYLAPGQWARATVRVASAQPFAAKAEIKLKWVDLWGRERDAGRAQIDAQGRAHLTYQCDVTPPDRGIYRLQATIVGADCALGEALLCVLPDAGSFPANAAGFFGNHAPPRLDPDSPNLGPSVARRCGARWYRVHDFANYVQWHWVEPRPGEFKWYDREVDFLRARGFEILGTLCRPPLWAGKAGPRHRRHRDWTSSPPRDLGEFAAYVGRTVAHHRDRIHTWEIWNEPYGGRFFSGPAEEYADVLKTGYRACKRADPACKVLGLCAYPGLPKWIERVLASAGTEWFDVFSYHTYFSAGHVRERDDGMALLARHVRQMRESMRGHGREKPLWHTEGGVACPTFYSWLPRNGWRCDPLTAARTLTKCAVLLRSVGVERWFYYFIGYAWGGHGSYYRLLNIPYIQIDFDGSPKPTLAAQAAAASFLDLASFEAALRVGAARIYLFRRAQDRVAVAWCERDAPGPALRVPEGCEVYDLTGARRDSRVLHLGADPYYVVGRDLTAEGLRERIAK